MAPCCLSWHIGQSLMPIPIFVFTTLKKCIKFVFMCLTFEIYLIVSPLKTIKQNRADESCTPGDAKVTGDSTVDKYGQWGISPSARVEHTQSLGYVEMKWDLNLSKTHASHCTEWDSKWTPVAPTHWTLCTCYATCASSGVLNAPITQLQMPFDLFLYVFLLIHILHKHIICLRPAPTHLHHPQNLHQYTH